MNPKINLSTEFARVQRNVETVRIIVATVFIILSISHRIAYAKGANSVSK